MMIGFTVRGKLQGARVTRTTVHKLSSPGVGGRLPVFTQPDG